MREGVGRAAALAFLTALCAVGAYQTSLVVDGTRYFWLYDAPMTGMLQARDLVEGRGTPAGPGASVEGYPSLLWTLVMAAAHLLPGGDAKAALAVLMLNWLLSCAVLLLAERLLRTVLPQPGLGLVVLWLALVPCFDLLFWSVNGFETPLLTALFLLVAIRLLAESSVGSSRASTYLLMGLLPLARTDGVSAWAGLALLALGTSPDRRRTTKMLAASLTLILLYALLPYSLGGRPWTTGGPPSAALLPTGPSLGVRYVARFAWSYGVALLLALTGALAMGDRRRWLLLGAVLIGAGHLLVWGGRALPGSPYLAHLVPVVVVLAVATLIEAGRRRRGLGVVLTVAFAAPGLVQAWVYSPTRFAASEPSGMVTGVLIRRFTAPETTVGVFAGGSVPYYSRRRTLALLAGSHPGEALRGAPDLVVVHLPHERVVAYAGGRQERDTLAPLLQSQAFREAYLPNALPVLDRTTIYFRGNSPERERRPRWKVPALGR